MFVFTLGCIFCFKNEDNIFARAMWTLDIDDSGYYRVLFTLQSKNNQSLNDFYTLDWLFSLKFWFDFQQQL